MVRNFIPTLLILGILWNTLGLLSGTNQVGQYGSKSAKVPVPPIKCKSNSFPCGDNSRCVHGRNLCDYNKDCDDFSDEQFSMCRVLREQKGSCSSGNLRHPNYGCKDIYTICYNEAYVSEEFLPLCNEITSGLKPIEEFAAKDEELSTLREKLTALQDETKRKDVFEHLASYFNESAFSKSNSSCPPLYVNISGKCMALFSVAKVTWAEAKQFCESISGTLAILKRMKDYLSLLKQLKSQDLTTDFWIGGHHTNSKSSNSSAWIWLDDEDIALGAPYWSLYCSSRNTVGVPLPVPWCYFLAPRENKEGFCLSLDYAFHYYFIDQNCNEKRSPLCFLNEK